MALLDTLQAYIENSIKLAKTPIKDNDSFVNTIVKDFDKFISGLPYQTTKRESAKKLMTDALNNIKLERAEMIYEIYVNEYLSGLNIKKYKVNYPPKLDFSEYFKKTNFNEIIPIVESITNFTIFLYNWLQKGSVKDLSKNEIYLLK